MSEITLPPEVASGFVDGVYALLVTDTGDADRLRNARAATEVTVTLTPKALRHVAGTPPMTILKRPIDLIIGPDGHIREKDAPASQDGPGVWVAVGVYKVAFSGALSANLPQAFDIEVTEAHTEQAPLWLSSAEHPVPAPGTPVTVLEVSGSPVPGYVVGVDENGVLTYVAGGTGGTGTDLTTYSQVSSLPDYPTTFPADLTGLATVATTGDYGDLTGTPTIPDAPTWDTLSGKPAVIAAGTSQTAARNAIGAGTSNLQIGTGSSTAAAGDHTHSQYATNTALTTHTGSTSNPHSVTKSQVGLGNVDNVSAAALRDRSTHTGTEPIAALPAGSVVRSATTARPTARTDIMVIFTGADPGTNALNGDLWLGA